MYASTPVECRRQIVIVTALYLGCVDRSRLEALMVVLERRTTVSHLTSRLVGRGKQKALEQR